MSTWHRLADYFVVVGYAPDQKNGGCGKVIEKFPEKDWPDCPFTPSIELFCQPTGWSLSAKRLQPTFFVSVLTDIDREFHYAACFTFYEPYKFPSEDDNDDVTVGGNTNMDEGDGGGGGRDSSNPDLVSHSNMFAPKSLILISQLNHFDTFRNCLGLIYSIYVDGSSDHYNCSIEDIIGKMLGLVVAPTSGGMQVKFSVGAGDKQSIQPPKQNTVPSTRDTVAVLFQELGIHNTLKMLSAALMDSKILFISQSCSRLVDASHGLYSLMFPLKYSYVYIPLLPALLVEVLNTPTPFIAGIHSMLSGEAEDLLDVIIVDLDLGSIKIPEGVQIPSMPEPMISRVIQSLTVILKPDLLAADLAFSHNSSERHTDLFQRDKEIRAVFLRFFAELFDGYRACLQIIRIHPDPVIQFHKAKFLGLRNFVEDPFLCKLLESMCFQTFVHTRGVPFRVCDLFDDVLDSLPEQLQEERSDPELTYKHIQALANTLYLNENAKSHCPPDKIPQPTEGAYKRVHLPTFPVINCVYLQTIIERELKKQKEETSKFAQLKPLQMRIVPSGSLLLAEQSYLVTQTKRLEVLHSCINFIFDGKISDARKILPAVLRTMKNRIARLALCQGMKQYVVAKRNLLENHQFDLIVKLFNAALQHESPMDENSIAAQILPLADFFYRKLSTGVLQFVYTLIQEHAVWANLNFWEGSFYEDVQQQLRSYYLDHYKEKAEKRSAAKLTEQSGGNESNSSSSSGPSVPELKREPTAVGRWSKQAIDFMKNSSPLEIAAEEMRSWDSVRTTEQDEIISAEESIVFSQALHYMNKLMYLRIPMDTRKGLKGLLSGDTESMSMRTTSYAESDLSNDAESGFDEQFTTEVTGTVSKVVTRFVNKVCGESGVSDNHTRKLHQMIPTTITMHCETLDSVYREFQRMPNFQKPKIVAPAMLPGEEMIIGNLRAYLLTDGREEGTGRLGGPALLPAEGALFLTRYRLVFKGSPCEMFASEQTVIRSFPVATLMKEQKLNGQYLSHMDQYLQNIIQFRSCIGQLMKIGFETEVSEESLETFRKSLAKARHPETVLETFAFSGADYISMPQEPGRKDKYQTLRGFKKTLMKLPKKAGFGSKTSSRPKNKYALRFDDSASGSRRSSFSDDKGDGTGSLASSRHSISVIEESEQLNLAGSVSSGTLDQRALDRMSQLLCYLEYERLGLGSAGGQKTRSADMFRVSRINSTYSLCRSYPALLVLPQETSEDSVQRFARCHRQSRFPVTTWRHPKTKALLLRASSFSGKSSRNILKQSGTTPMSSEPSYNSNTSELEKYLIRIRSLTPAPPGSTTRSAATSPTAATINSAGGNNRASPGGASVSGKEHAFGRLSGFGSRGRAGSGQRFNTLLPSGDLIAPGQAQLSRAQLYVLCEKNQVKHLKVDQMKQCDFIPVEYRSTSAVLRSFKKLLRACCPSTEQEEPFYKQIEESGWLSQLQNLLHLAGATVDLLDIQGSSVVVALEDGADITAQVVSIAQVLLDPYYRTVQGFRALVEKDWLAFGHKFSSRMNQLASSDSASFAPIFLQFLDVIHQIHIQFPLSFEFNEFYLRFLAYHSVSNRFRTFMLDSEQERLEAGWLLDDLPRSQPPPTAATSSSSSPPGGATSGGPSSPDHHHHHYFYPSRAPVSSGMGLSVWDYIESKHAESPMFYNFSYLPEQSETVLRPQSNLPNIRLWSFYTEENLSSGSPYDMELANEETKRDSGDITSAGDESEDRRTVNLSQDNVEDRLKHAFAALFLEYGLLAPAGKWLSVWKNLDRPAEFRRQYSLSTQYCRNIGQSMHKKSTIDFLVRGKLVSNEANKMFSQPHAFDKYHYTTPAPCDYCSHILWGLVKTGLKCTECGYNCHEKCMSHVPKNCICLRTPSSGEAVNSQVVSSNRELANEPNEAEDIEMMTHNQNEHRSHEGYLWKQSNFMIKGWKKRWFVLDSVKHQLRYYDSQDDRNCKGFIDLGEVQQVESTRTHNPGAPKKAHEDAFFELKTPRRVFVFLASDKKKALEWIELIQSKLVG